MADPEHGGPRQDSGPEETSAVWHMTNGQARHFLAAIVDSCEDSIVTIDLEGIITSWNKAAERLYGFSARETLGKSFSIVALPPDLAAVREKTEEIRQGGRVGIYDVMRVTRGGREMQLEVVLSPVKNDGGEIIGVSTLAREVTERRLAEQELHINLEQFRRAVEDSPVPVVMVAEDGEVLQLSRAWTEMTGYTVQDMPDFEVWLEQTYAGGGDALRDHVRRLFAGDARHLDTDIEITTRAGERRHWAFSASAPGKLRDGRCFLVGMALDITERKRVEEALRQNQEWLRLVLENAREYAIFTMDLERRVTSWNVGAERLLGWREAEIVGQIGDVIFTEEDRANGAAEGEAVKALKEGRAADERWHVRKDGSRFWGSGSMMSMQDSGGEVIGFVKIFRDETENRKNKEALEQSRQELWEALQENERVRAEVESAAAAKDQFLAVLSHELRTPLTPVLMSVHAWKRRRDLPDDVSEGLEMISRNVEMEARFIDELLDVTRISRGKLEIVRGPVDLHATVRNAIVISKPDLDAKGQQLTVELAAEQTQVSGDDPRLQQVIWNLLKNASKFTPEQGRIGLRTYNEPGKVCVEIQDNGIGIERAALPRIFNPFAQGSQQVTQRYGGLGLGLAIAKATADAHGGSLRAESEGGGKGAKFTLSLPLS